MKKYLLERASEPSTWRGISLFLTAFGIYVDPALFQQITTVGLSVVGLIGIATKG